MDNRRGRTAQTSEARGSVKEAIGKVIGDAHAEAEGAAEKKAARERRRQRPTRQEEGRAHAGPRSRS
ncbi:hypothetical protein LMG28727_05460 [Paraburkholderia kirstenboschensis]|jgi:hypothetical protein|nr:CsbD family protein [Paraburkholderia kirstenboschensis]CAD6553021.1 hypothetical protein LMG28727_05460 [Paraburkholderia kirstenboschensis]